MRLFPPDLPEKKRQRIVEEVSRPQELVVIQPLNRDWKCHRCSGTGGLLIMEPPGPACLRCAGLDDLEFLPSGNALLTRRVKAKSARTAVGTRNRSPRIAVEGRYLARESAMLVA